VGAREFSLPHSTQTGCETLPVFYIIGYVSLSPGSKAQEREADHSLHSSTEVKNAWSYTETPPYIFMIWRLFMHHDRITLIIIIIIINLMIITIHSFSLFERPGRIWSLFW
jgi:hypothetical protein